MVTEADELADLLAAPEGLRVVEVPTVRTELRGFLGSVRTQIAAALSS